MDSIFLLKTILSVLLLPPLLPLLVIALGLLLMRYPRWGRIMPWYGLLLALFLSTPATVKLLTEPLESVPVLTEQDLGRGQAIVILGGGLRRSMPEYGGPTPNRLTLERLRYGARLARSSGLPVLVSGGAPTGYVAEAQLMADSLREDFKIRPRWIEARSLNTEGNARYSAAMLQAEGIRRVVLVTHAAHMRRASNEFRLQGFDVIAAPTAFLTDKSGGREFFDFMPGATAAYAGWYALHEWLGLLAQSLR